eukprot:3200929-Amphidinium_carterae.1
MLKCGKWCSPKLDSTEAMSMSMAHATRWFWWSGGAPSGIDRGFSGKDRVLRCFCIGGVGGHNEQLVLCFQRWLWHMEGLVAPAPVVLDLGTLVQQVVSVLLANFVQVEVAKVEQVPSLGEVHSAALCTQLLFPCAQPLGSE